MLNAFIGGELTRDSMGSFFSVSSTRTGKDSGPPASNSSLRKRVISRSNLLSRTGAPSSSSGMSPSSSASLLSRWCQYGSLSFSP